MESHDWKHIRSMLDKGPFRNGTDCCCSVHTCASKYKRSLNELMVSDPVEIPDILEDMRMCCITILHESFRMSEICGRLYVLGVCL